MKNINKLISSVPFRTDTFLVNSILLMEEERQIPGQTHDKDSSFTLIINSYVFPYTVMTTEISTLNNNKNRFPILNIRKHLAILMNKSSTFTFTHM